MYPLAADSGIETCVAEREPIRGELVGVTRGTTADRERQVVKRTLDYTLLAYLPLQEWCCSA